MALNLPQGLVLWAAGGVQPRPAAERRRLGRPGQGDVEEVMTITDPLTVQVADLHGIARNIQSA
jgi:hypothetical protein